MLPGFNAKAGSRVTAKIFPSSSFNPKNNGDYNEGNITYDANGNIQTLQRNKNTVAGSNAMDNLTYNYDSAKPNQLSSVDDAVTAPTNAQDIKDQNANNYKYNSIGQLTENVSEGIKYVYNASGLVTEVRKNSLPLVKFFYSDKGYRVKKEAYNNSGNLTNTDYYVSDVAGNVMAIYRGSTLTEQAIYGASRIGVYKRASNSSVYELTDHLGNVRAVIGKDSNNNMLMLSRRDYYPFGMPMPDRNIVGDYRYAFQGQELDSETGMEAFQLRLWDGRIGRWLSPDPYGQYDSPYLGMGNNPIGMIDPDGGKADDWYLPIGETDQSKAVWIEGSGPQAGYNWLGGENFIFDGFTLNEVIIKIQPKDYFLKGYFDAYRKYGNNEPNPYSPYIPDNPFFHYVGNHKGVDEYESIFAFSGAFTPGPFVVYPRGESKNPYYSTHEPGHVLQYRMLGFADYWKKVAIPSLVFAATHNPEEASHYYTETQANRMWWVHSRESNERHNPFK
jgi:RHS repeat-associated protein